MVAKLLQGDCLDRLRELPDCSVDAIVTDPPYGLSFMGKKWDYDVPSVEIWAECLRVLKPGGYLLAFAGTRTQHRMAVRIEDAGFEIRDMIAWVYGSGFPKSLDVSKAIDKAAGATRDVVATIKKTPSAGGANTNEGWVRPWAEGKTTMDITTPATEAARQWKGWGTALKPALEPITVARKPLIGTVAENVLAHGTGAMNIDGCRVETDDALQGSTVRNDIRGGAFAMGHKPSPGDIPSYQQNDLGRWPANLIHDGSEEVTELFPVTGPSKAAPRNNGEFKSVAKGHDLPHVTFGHDDNGGSASRFFYCAKASKRDRDEGLEEFEAKPAYSAYGEGLNTATKIRTEEQAENGVSRELRRNSHPTVKPTDLMRYLCRLVTPPSGVVLDPFMGSGSTGKGAALEGFDFIGIERDPEYYKIAEARIEAAKNKMAENLW